MYIIFGIMIGFAAGFLAADFFITHMICQEFDIENNWEISWQKIFNQLQKKDTEV